MKVEWAGAGRGGHGGGGGATVQCGVERWVPVCGPVGLWRGVRKCVRSDGDGDVVVVVGGGGKGVSSPEPRS
jgi:hypothetical protein